MEGNVYILRAIGTNRYKIGHTVNGVEGRVAELQTGSPHKIIIMMQTKCPNAKQTEAILHKTFAQYRVQGEWFELENVSSLIECLHGLIHPDARYEIFTQCLAGHSDQVSDLFSMLTPQTQTRMLLTMVADLSLSLRLLKSKNERLTEKVFALDEELVQANYEINRLNGLIGESPEWADDKPNLLRDYRVWD